MKKINLKETGSGLKKSFRTKSVRFLKLCADRGGHRRSCSIQSGNQPDPGKVYVL